MGTANPSEVTTTTSVNQNVLTDCPEGRVVTKHLVEIAEGPDAVGDPSFLKERHLKHHHQQQGDDDEHSQTHRDEGRRAHPESPPPHPVPSPPSDRLLAGCVKTPFPGSKGQSVIPAKAGIQGSWRGPYPVFPHSTPPGFPLSRE